MRQFSQSLLEEMETTLLRIHADYPDTVTVSAHAIRELVSILEKLKSFLIRYKFSDSAEEIDFFRNVKPIFSSRLIYYNELYSIELGKPVCREKILRKYYKSKSDRLKMFFDENADFYKYYRSGSKELDRLYFIRGPHAMPMTFDSSYFQADSRFATAKDYDVSRILANEQLLRHIEAMLGNPYGKESSSSIQALRWTASKVSLVELIYALHAQGPLNNGQLELKALAEFFQRAFSVDLGQFNKTFLEIRERKDERARFITSLKEKLILRMEEADEN